MMTVVAFVITPRRTGLKVLGLAVQLYDPVMRALFIIKAGYFFDC